MRSCPSSCKRTTGISNGQTCHKTEEIKDLRYVRDQRDTSRVVSFRDLKVTSESIHMYGDKGNTRYCCIRGDKSRVGNGEIT